MHSLHKILWLGISCLTLHTSLAQTVQHTLNNGLNVIIEEDHRAPVVQTQLWYKVGSMDEQAGKTGLSHALEHMMFKGTHTVPAGEYSRQISALGGEENAYTSMEETVYHVTIAAEHLPKVLQLEADRMANLNFSDEAFTNEMKVIREERRERVEDDPDGLLYEQLLMSAWQKSGNRTHVIGTMADLHTLTANDLRDWYRQWYAPNNATLLIVGDVDSAQTLKWVQQYFGDLASKKQPARSDNTEIMQRDTSPISITGKTKQPIMMLAYRVPHLQKMDDTLPYALDVLSTVLDGHSAARLSKNLVRGSQIAQNADISYNVLARQPQLWTISATPAEGVSLPTLRAGLEQQIAQIAQNGVSESELRRAKRLEQASEIYSRDNMSSRASLMGTLHNIGFSYHDEAEIRRRLNEITPQQVQAAAQFLQQQNAIYVEMLPEK